MVWRNTEPFYAHVKLFGVALQRAVKLRYVNDWYIRKRYRNMKQYPSCPRDDTPIATYILDHAKCL